MTEDKLPLAELLAKAELLPAPRMFVRYVRPILRKRDCL